jgi:hypothetical protein
MINTKELRLGNWVTYKESSEARGVDIQVSEIRKGGISNEFMLQKTDNPQFQYTMKQFPVNKIFPIPLTEKILLETDLRDCCDGDFIDDMNGFIYKNLRGSRFKVSKGESSIAFIEYVHQLQNLYFALSCEELEVKL